MITSWGPLARLRRRWSRWDTALLSGSFLLLVGAGLPLPGYSAGPGPVRAVSEFVDVGASKVFPPAGEVLMATVALHPLSPFRALQAWLDSDIEAVDSDDLVSSERRGLDMEESRDVAAAVALRRLGFAVPEREEGFDYPFPVTIRATGVDGNSAGLAFTLGILDQLTPGELTGGKKIGVTGTIEINGDVGPVGSIAHKTVAVREAGGNFLLVPAGQGREAAAHSGSALEIFEVSTLDDAITTLEGLGGDVGPLRRPA